MWNTEAKDKKVLVIGAARSGCAVAAFLSKKGAFVTLTDGKPASKLMNELELLKNLPIQFVLGQDPEIYPESFNYAVISPGVPLDIPLVKKIRQAKIPLTGELEIAFQYSRSPIVAITGTNGKTTTTSLMGQIYTDAHLPAFVGGNIGIPLVTAVEDLSPEGVIIAEVSSFQLETVDAFRPKVAVILNITPDHLDRHKTMRGYIDAKARIFENQQETDFTVLNYDDSRVKKLALKCPGQVVFFSRKKVLDRGVYVKNGIIIIKTEDDCINVINTADIYIKGKHNLENALAATAAAFCLGISPKDIAYTLQNFAGVAHRLEFVKNVAGVDYVNDSKGTNPDSTIKALEAYDQPILLIAGGKSKGSDFTKLAQLVKKKVRALILVGEASAALRHAMQAENFTFVYQAESFPETVSIASKLAQPGDVVLLSPACASWDMFNNYEERGDLFKKLVNELI